LKGRFNIPGVSKTSKSIGALLFVTVVWGTTFPMQKAILGSLNPFLYNALRFAVASVVVVIFFKPRENQWKSGTILGIFLGFAYATQTLGLKLTTSTKSGFITSLYIILVPLFSLLIEQTKPTLLQTISFSLSVPGLYLLNDPSSSPFTLGDFFTVICAFSFAVHVVMITKLSANFHETSLLLPQLLVTSAINFVLAPFGGSSRFTFEAVFVMVYTAVMATVIVIWLQLKHQKVVGSNVSALIYVGEPVFATIASVIALGEKVSLPQLFGMFVLVASLCLATVRKTEKTM